MQRKYWLFIQAVLFLQIFLTSCTESEKAQTVLSIAPARTYVQPPPPPADTSLSYEAQLFSDWYDANESAMSTMQSAVGLFESEIFGPNKLDNRGIARSAIVLYKALNNVPLQPPSIPYSSDFNRAINQMTIVMQTVSAFALAGDDLKMLIAITEWERARKLYTNWHASLRNL